MNTFYFSIDYDFLISKRISNEKKVENKFNCSIFSWLMMLILSIHFEYLNNTAQYMLWVISSAAKLLILGTRGPLILCIHTFGSTAFNKYVGEGVGRS